MREITALMRKTNELAKFNMLPKSLYANAWVEKDKIGKEDTNTYVEMIREEVGQ